MAERKGLGRGLSSLMGSPPGDVALSRVLEIPLAEIAPNPHQPRQEWDEGSLQELADSIRSSGILQPLIVRGRPGKYELIAGERRLRAARLAGLQRVPAILRETDEPGSLKLALIENIQREDISPLDSARAYQQLMDEFGMTQDEVAQSVGKSRPTVANTLRLLQLPPAILESLRSRQISEGHARALLGVKDSAEQQRLWERAKTGASVREIEADALAGKAPPAPTKAPVHPAAQLRTARPEPRSLPHLDALAERLRRALGTRVEIRGNDQRGILCLEYYSDEDLNSLASLLLGGATSGTG